MIPNWVWPRLLIGMGIGLILVALIAVLSGCGTTKVLAPYRPTVVHVRDGDTIDLDDGTAVRFAGIDTPERGQCGYKQATIRLEELVLGKQVKLTPAGTKTDKDRYGRLLRYVSYQTEDIGGILIDEGLAKPRYNSTDGYGPHDKEAEYNRRYAKAKPPPVC